MSNVSTPVVVLSAVSVPHVVHDIPLLSLDGSTSHVTMLKHYCCVLNVQQTSHSSVTFICESYVVWSVHYYT